MLIVRQIVRRKTGSFRSRCSGALYLRSRALLFNGRAVVSLSALHVGSATCWTRIRLNFEILVNERSIFPRPFNYTKRSETDSSEVLLNEKQFVSIRSTVHIYSWLRIEIGNCFPHCPCDVLSLIVIALQDSICVSVESQENEKQ